MFARVAGFAFFELPGEPAGDVEGAAYTVMFQRVRACFAGRSRASSKVKLTTPAPACSGKSLRKAWRDRRRLMRRASLEAESDMSVFRQRWRDISCRPHARRNDGASARTVSPRNNKT